MSVPVHTCSVHEHVCLFSLRGRVALFLPNSDISRAGSAQADGGLVTNWDMVIRISI